MLANLRITIQRNAMALCTKATEILTRLLPGLIVFLKKPAVNRAIDWKLKWGMLYGLKIPSDLFINSLFNDDVHSAAYI